MLRKTLPYIITAALITACGGAQPPKPSVDPAPIVETVTEQETAPAEPVIDANYCASLGQAFDPAQSICYLVAEAPAVEEETLAPESLPSPAAEETEAAPVSICEIIQGPIVYSTPDWALEFQDMGYGSTKYRDYLIGGNGNVTGRIIKIENGKSDNPVITPENYEKLRVYELDSNWNPVGEGLPIVYDVETQTYSTIGPTQITESTAFSLFFDYSGCQMNGQLLTGVLALPTASIVMVGDANNSQVYGLSDYVVQYVSGSAPTKGVPGEPTTGPGVPPPPPPPPCYPSCTD